MTRTLVAMVGLLASGTAWALDVDICAQYDVDYPDADPSFGDDYLTDNSVHVPAAGAKIRVIDLATGGLVFDDYADEDGPDVGCVTATGLSSSGSYRIAVLSTAQVNDNTITVLNNPTIKQKYAYAVNLSYPIPGVPITLTTNAVRHWGWMAAATHALGRSNAGLSGEVFRFYRDNSSCSSGSCTGEDDLGPPLILASNMCPTCSNTLTKTLPLHEMGHMVARYANGGAKVVGSCTYTGTTPIDVCTVTAPEGGKHGLNSEEVNGCAASEGIAHFWAVYAFNDQSGGDCKFDWYGDWVDWNNSLSDQTWEWIEDRINCQGLPSYSTEMLALGVDGEDYHGDICGGAGGLGTELDWMRMFWDLVNLEGIPVADVYEIWDGADPEGWAANGWNVESEMAWGAVFAGWYDEYLVQAYDNGNDP